MTLILLYGSVFSECATCSGPCRWQRASHLGTCKPRVGCAYFPVLDPCNCMPYHSIWDLAQNLLKDILSSQLKPETGACNKPIGIPYFLQSRLPSAAESMCHACMLQVHPCVLPAQGAVQCSPSLHLMDPHHSVDCGTQHAAQIAPAPPQAVWLAGMHHFRNIHLSVSPLAVLLKD